MIGSCEFSFDENSVWDIKAIRQNLIISEDEVNILKNIPGWTKEKNDNYYSRIKENDSCINSHVELNPSNSLRKNQEVINCNIELFDKSFDSRENIIQAYKLNALKFSKCISLFEIHKINTNSPCSNHLSPALSLPNLSLFSKDFSAHFETKSYLCDKSDLSTQLKSDVLNTINSKICLENTKMEEVSQLPTVVPQIVKNNENFAIVDKTILLANETIQLPHNSSNSCHFRCADVNKSDHLCSDATKKAHLVEIDKLNSSDENVASLKSSMQIKQNVHNCNLDLQENTTKFVEPTDLNLFEKMETDLTIVKESISSNNGIHDTSEKTELEGLNVIQKKGLEVIVEENVVNNDSSLNKDENFHSYVEDNTLNKYKEIAVENSKQLGIVPQLCESKITLVSSNELKSKLPDNLHDSKMDADITFKTSCQGAGDGQAVNTHTLPLKRKSESKSRSSKRYKNSREKQRSPDGRSIKKSGEIHYSAEDTKIMFDLLKLFL